jgi:hypothetical protein
VVLRGRVREEDGRNPVAESPDERVDRDRDLGSVDMRAAATTTWRTIAARAAADLDRPAFVRGLADRLLAERPRLDLPGDVTLGDMRGALAGLEPVPTHRTSAAGARALLDADAWRAADEGRGENMVEAGVLGLREDSSGIGFVAVHLRDVDAPGQLAVPLGGATYGEVRLWYRPDALHDMTFTARQHHEMRANDLVARGTVESLHRIYAQRLVDWVGRGGAAPEGTRDALRGWLLQQDQFGPYLLEGQARGLRGDQVRAIELLVDVPESAALLDELVATARGRGIDVIDRRPTPAS